MLCLARLSTEVQDDSGKNVTASNRRLIRWAAWLSVVALIAHAIDAPDHLTEWWGYSTFFVIVGAFQFFLGLAMFIQPWKYDEDGRVRSNADRFGRAYYRLGIILTASVIVLYAVSRTAGMPFFGPDAITEPVTPLSLVPIAEAVPLMYCLVKLLIRTRAHP